MRAFFHFANLYDGRNRSRLSFQKRYDDICAEWLGTCTSRAGNYLNFLRRGAKEALESGRPLKAAKRLLALSRLVSAKGFGNFFGRILNENAPLTRNEDHQGGETAASP